MGNRMRARKASCRRWRRLTKPRPAAYRDLLGQAQPGAQLVPGVGGPPQPEAADHLAVVAAAAQVVAGLAGVGSDQQPLVVPLGGLLHGVEQDLAPLAVPARARVLADGDARLVGQAPHRIDEVEVLDGPDEADGVALGLAAEAVVEALVGVDAERRGLLAVERAQADPPAPLPLERGVLPDEGHDVRCGPHPGDVLIGDPHRGRRYRVAAGAPSAGAGRRVSPWPWPGTPALAAARLPPWPPSPVAAVVWPASTAWAAASRAMGTRNGEQLT